MTPTEDDARRERLGKMAESIRIGLWTEALRLAYDYDMAKTFDDACGLFADDLAALSSSVPPETTEVADISGEMWAAGRSKFATYAERYHMATTTNEAMAIADVAPAEIWRAMRQAEMLLALSVLHAVPQEKGRTDK